MPLYKCEICNFSSNIKQHYKRHTNTKKHRNNLIDINKHINEIGVIIQNNPCLIQNNPVNPQNNPLIIQNNPSANSQKLFKCDFCPKMFTLHSNKRRHEIHRCRDNPDFMDKIVDAKNNKIKTLQKDKEALEKDKELLQNEKAILYKQVSSLLDKVGDTTNIQNNIILNNYGKEDLSHITDTLKTELLSAPYGAIPKMIEAIHFNDQKPENKNIVLPNKKENLIKVFEGDKWIYKNKNDTITDLVDSKYSIIDDHYDNLDGHSSVHPHIKTTFTKFKKYYENSDIEMVDTLRNQCELVLLNNR